MKKWYAVQQTSEDEWGNGSFNFREAVKMAKKLGPDSQIAVIDGGYDKNGNQTTDTICIAEYHNGIDF